MKSFSNLLTSLCLLTLACPSLAVPLGLGHGSLVPSLWHGLQNILGKSQPLLESSATLIPYEQFESWLENETKFSFESIIDNIGGYGSGIDDVMPGLVIASPSKKDPNYYYQWTRDAAITINSLVTKFDDGKGTNSTLKDIIEDYISSSKHLQRIDNPSGTFESLNGLGEPKFEVNGSAFLGPWGRPQRDGPALRAITMINYINSQVRHNSSATYEDFRPLYDEVIKHDLDYVAQKWGLNGFDLWEEINGMHFYTMMVQQRSLVEGSKLARILGYTTDRTIYDRQATGLRIFIENHFFDTSKGHLVETLNSDRSGLDSALFLGSIHAGANFDGEYDEENFSTFTPNSEPVIATLSSYIDDMRDRFPINMQRLHTFQQYGVNSSIVGVGVGRYPEDVYNGAGTSVGNPWFLCTATVAQNIYILADYLSTRPDDFVLHITPATVKLYGMFLEVSSGFDWSQPSFSLPKSSPSFKPLIRSLVSYGDSFLDVIREHHDAVGRMSEQFNRYDGYMTGAKQLTWSYGAFWSASRQRTIVLDHLNETN